MTGRNSVTVPRSVALPRPDPAALFRRAPTPFVVIDADFTIVEANDAYCAVTMRDLADIVGVTIFEAFPAGPHDPEGVSTEALRRSLTRARDKGQVDHIALIKYDIPQPDGTFHERYWSATHTPLLDAQGDVAFILQHTTDVTDVQRLRVAAERGVAPTQAGQVAADMIRRAEAVQAENWTLESEREHMLRLFAQAPGFMAVLSGPEHVFEIANASFGALVGHRDVLGLKVREAVPEVSDQGFLELLDEVYRTGRAFVGRGMTARLRQSPDGALEERAIDLVYQPIVAPDGSVSGIFVQGNDITEQKRAEDALHRFTQRLERMVEERTLALIEARRALEDINRDLEAIVATRTAELRNANEEIQRFAYIVSHDLRSPLVNIMGFTSELETVRATVERFQHELRTVAPERIDGDIEAAITRDLPEAIGFIRSSTQKMDRLIGAVLRLSREGRRVLSAEPVAMGELVHGIKRSLETQFDETGTVLEMDELPDLISDRLALEQIFGNLIENAVKYLVPGRPGRVAIRARVVGERAVFDVSDNGRGIEPRDYERVFDLFRRAGRQDKPGEGIGLAHVRALARRLGGGVTVRSTLGEGSTFSVDLPLRLQSEPE